MTTDEPTPDEQVHMEPSRPQNDRVYLHEYIDVIGQQRSRYMHHMTAYWCPESRRDRDQLCFGVWGVLGSTGHWPQVVNLWEYPGGWDALAEAFGFEVSGPGMQDPKLQEWWHQAASLRRGGDDRLLVPAPWTRTIEGLVADGVTGIAYAHERYDLPPGSSSAFLDVVRAEGQKLVESTGLELAGAFNVALRNDTECILLWAIPDWPTWAAFESGWLSDGPLQQWRARLVELDVRLERILLVDSPLNPMKTGRQPAVEDRRPMSEFFPPIEG